MNKELILLKDFQREIAIKSKQNPSYKVTPHSVQEQMDTVIDRKLMIQEAMKMGLAGNEDFIRTIQSFWEQTLIRELIEKKSSDWEDQLFVTDHEVREFYASISKGNARTPPLDSIYDQIKKSLVDQKKTAALEEWLSDKREKAVIDINAQLMNELAPFEGQAQRNGGEDVR